MGPRGDPHRRGRPQPVCGHAPAGLPAPDVVEPRPVPQGRVRPPHRQPQAPAGASLFLFGLCSGTIGPDTTIIEASSAPPPCPRPTSRACWGCLRRGHAAHDLAAEDRPDRVPRRQLPHRRRPRLDLRGPRWRRARTATTWTSSRTPSASPTGAATTTSRSRSSSRWHRSGTRSRAGWCWAPAPGTSATIGRYVRYKRRHVRVRRGPRGQRLPGQLVRQRRPGRAPAGPGSRGSAGPAWSRPSSAPSSTR